MPEKFSKWDAAKHLWIHNDWQLYLQVCTDEDRRNGSLVGTALTDAARAENLAALAREPSMSREVLYKALPADSNPTFVTE